MSQVKNNNTKATRIAGGALVVLSSFVPMPQTSSTGSLMTGGAQAAKVTIPVTGKFITGITLSNAKAINFSKFVATAKTGTFGIKQTADSPTAGADGKTVTAPKRGKFNIKVKVDAAVDVKVSKIGNDITLGATAGGVSTGSMTLSKINFGTVFDSTGAAVTLTTAGGTTAKQTGVAIKFAELSGAGATGTLGAVLKWAGTRPVGSISNGNGGNIVLTVIY